MIKKHIKGALFRGHPLQEFSFHGKRLSNANSGKLMIPQHYSPRHALQSSLSNISGRVFAHESASTCWSCVRIPATRGHGQVDIDIFNSWSVRKSVGGQNFRHRGNDRRHQGGVLDTFRIATSLAHARPKGTRCVFS